MTANLPKIGLLAAVAFGALALAESGASAMPALDQTVVTTTTTMQGVERAYWSYRHRWHCWHHWHRWHPYW
ncbi:MAG TPA: hypothetical protein VLZ74_04075 [Methylocella sp.]|nr:hypothetical protein [Methylocella sp.]